MHWFSREAWSDLVAGKLAILPMAAGESVSIVFPGAFNPLHAGHVQMAAHAERTHGAAVCYELSIQNVDKPRLEFDEVARRLARFGEQQVVLTSAATFAEKAALFPAATFVIGVDTLLRVGDARYYDGSQEAMLRAIDAIAAQDCRFLVFGRALEDAFHTGESVAIPAQLATLCDAVAEEEFRVDVSSTGLRDDT